MAAPQDKQAPIAQVYVAPSPFVERARSRDTVSFYDVPPGEYQVVTWHPRLPGSAQPISLRGDDTSRATVTVGVNALSDSSGSSGSSRSSRSSR